MMKTGKEKDERRRMRDDGYGLRKKLASVNREKKESAGF